MNYKLHITNKAVRDMKEAADYIEFNLMNPQASDALLDKADEEINGLAFMPEKHKTVDDPILAAWGIRMIIVNNYFAFYIIDKDTKTVHIIRFLYGKRNWMSILRNEPFSFD